MQIKIYLSMLASIILMTGCFGESSNLELIVAAQEGLLASERNQIKQNEEIIENYNTQLKQLDSAFDADVKLAESGKLLDESGKPITLDSNWIISARKGYSTGYKIIHNNLVAQQKFNRETLQNLESISQALEIIRQRSLLKSNMSATLRSQFEKLFERNISDANQNSSAAN